MITDDFFLNLCVCSGMPSALRFKQEIVLLLTVQVWSSSISFDIFISRNYPFIHKIKYGMKKAMLDSVHAISFKKYLIPWILNYIYQAEKNYKNSSIVYHNYRRTDYRS